MVRLLVAIMVLALVAICLLSLPRNPSTAQSNALGFESNEVAGKTFKYTFGLSIETLELPEATGGSGSYVYSLEANAPPYDVPGLSFDTSARTLTGTPSKIGEFKMTYRAEDPSSEIELKFTIVVKPGASRTFGQPLIRTPQASRSHGTRLPAPPSIILTVTWVQKPSCPLVGRMSVAALTPHIPTQM